MRGRDAGGAGDPEASSQRADGLFLLEIVVPLVMVDGSLIWHPLRWAHTWSRLEWRQRHGSFAHLHVALCRPLERFLS